MSVTDAETEGRRHFHDLVRQVVDAIAGRPLDGALQAHLNAAVPADGALFQQIEATCRQAVADGWMCDREHGGIRFGRVFKPDAELGGFSVDVVGMPTIKGPHHGHPNGEIDMIMPLDEGACFDGHPRGWLVYGPGSAHHPTVTGGEALVLYLLPDGAISFSRA